ncbi:MAG TPA: HAMP domain-containing sensor histidine kinase [Acidobacteriaceae bacterium]|nr:HAMP domain-containing sensor histidine kinase [Acidobacteriaceae bacterium]
MARLAATMAHEINIPLESARNPVNLADGARGGEASDGVFGIGGTGAGTGLADRAPDAGFYRETAVAGPVDLGELAEPVLAMHENKLRPKDIGQEKRLQPCPAATILAGGIRQVMAILISNAANAVRQGGRIRFTLAHCHAPDGVQIVVEDDGPGIAARGRERLFEPFFTTKKRRGHRPGLWVSREVRTPHGGKPEFAERHGPDGLRTAFIATLPLNGLIASEDPGEVGTTTA